MTGRTETRSVVVGKLDRTYHGDWLIDSHYITSISSSWVEEELYRLKRFRGKKVRITVEILEVDE